MNPAVKDLWVQALLSGEFTQAKGSLAVYSDEGQLQHCCLGVLCELAMREGLNVAREEPLDDDDQPYETPEDKEGHDVAFDNSTDLLPDSVMEWAGLDSSAGDFLEPVLKGDGMPALMADNSPVMERRSLAERNDEGVPFSEIAELIKKHF